MTISHAADKNIDRPALPAPESRFGKTTSTKGTTTMTTKRTVKTRVDGIQQAYHVGKSVRPREAVQPPTAAAPAPLAPAGQEKPDRETLAYEAAIRLGADEASARLLAGNEHTQHHITRPDMRLEKANSGWNLNCPTDHLYIGDKYLAGHDNLTSREVAKLASEELKAGIASGEIVLPTGARFIYRSKVSRAMGAFVYVVLRGLTFEETYFEDPAVPSYKRTIRPDVLAAIQTAANIANSYRRKTRHFYAQETRDYATFGVPIDTSDSQARRGPASGAGITPATSPPTTKEP